MARIIDFEQDEDRPFGVGRFKLDDGTDYYLDDAPRARSVLDEFYGGSNVTGDVARESTNIAERGSTDRKGRELDGKERYENAVAKLAGATEPNKPFHGIDSGPSRLRRAVAGPGGGEEDEPTESRDESMSREPDEPLESRQPDPERPPLSEEELRKQGEARETQTLIETIDPYRRSAGVDPRRMQREGVPVDTAFSRKGGLAPEEYNRQAQDRAAAYQATNATAVRHQQENELRAQAEAERLRAEAIGMRKVNDAQQLGLQRKQQKYEDDRAWLEKEVDAHYDDKADPDGGLRAKRGPLGNIASVVAQMMGAYAAVISGSPNFANQILNKKMDQARDAQIEDFRRGRAKRDGQLARMAERGMSLEQMRGALKVQQELALQREIRAQALEEGTRDSAQAAEKWIMSRQEDFITAENKFRTEALGENTVSGQMVQPRAAAAVRKTPREIFEEAAGTRGAFNKLEHEVRGGDYAERAEDRADKRAERETGRADKQEGRITSYADKMSKEGAPLKKVESAIGRLEAIRKQHGGLPGVGTVNFKGLPYTEQRKLADEVEQLQQTIVNSLLQANPGSASEGDAQRYAVEAFGKGTEEGALQGIAQAREFVDSKLASIEASASPEEREAYQRREDEARLARKRKRAAGGSSTGEAY